MDDPSYELKMKESLTLKPDGFLMRSSLRRHKSANELVAGLSTGFDPKKVGSAKAPQNPASSGGKPISILYGTNSGTCEALAHRLAGDVAQRGFLASRVEPMDAATNNLPTGHPVIILTSSYDGNPPENAVKFVKWLESARPSGLNGVSYAVFGCGKFFHLWSYSISHP